MDSLDFRPPTLANWANDVENDDTPTFIIKDILPADNLILLSGQPKDAKKTWYAMLTALVACTGHSVGSLKSVQKVPVLYIYREGARRATLNRFKALERGHGFPPLQSIDNLYFHHRGNFWLDQKDSISEVCEFITKHNIKLVYVDTFAKSMQSDENSSREVGLAIQNAERMRDAGATVVLVHHLKKGAPSLSNGKSGTPEPDKDLRGSSALAGAYEMHWAIRSYPDEDRQKRTQLFIGGKETEWSTFSYDWNFEMDVLEGADRVLKAASLKMEPVGELPHILSPEAMNERESWA